MKVYGVKLVYAHEGEEVKEPLYLTREPARKRAEELAKKENYHRLEKRSPDFWWSEYTDIRVIEFDVKE